MPRAASRLTLEITDVRVQRLQDITDDDAKAEGIREFTMTAAGRETRLYGTDPLASEQGRTPREGFQIAWDAINGKRARWAVNPWVWAISFRRV
jgi:hypothetical protein